MNNNDLKIDDQISIFDFINIIWNSKKFVVRTTIFFAVLSVIYSLTTEVTYKSSALIMSESDGTEKIGSSLSQYSGLASMAGINLPSMGSEDKNALIISTLKSRSFIKHLVGFDDVLPNIMASKGYDKDKKILIYDPKIYDHKKNLWVRDPKPYQPIIPTYLEVHKKYTEDIISIYEDDESKFITVSVEHHSPIYAEEFLSLIINQLNFLMKEKALYESEKAISFLVPQLDKAMADVKLSIISLIDSQLKIQMLANSKEEYSVKYIDPPYIPEKKYKPKRAIICILGTLLGFIISIIYVILRFYIKILKN